LLARVCNACRDAAPLLLARVCNACRVMTAPSDRPSNHYAYEDLDMWCVLPFPPCPLCLKKGRLLQSLFTLGSYSLTMRALRT
jgi:hypothetical protein